MKIAKIVLFALLMQACSHTKELRVSHAKDLQELQRIEQSLNESEKILVQIEKDLNRLEQATSK